jgi:DNA-binding transcriptional ArsR family regulator
VTYETAIAALADPTRRAIVERLRHGPLPVGDLARGMAVSRPAVSQHLRVLAEAGLLVARPCGARRIYALDPAGMEPVRRWLDALWDDALAQFAAAAAAEAAGEARREGDG